MNYDWIKWAGGKEPPVHGGTRVDVRLRDGDILLDSPAALLSWADDSSGRGIVAYRTRPLSAAAVETMALQLRAAGYTVTKPRGIDDIEPMREAPANGTVYYFPFLLENVITSRAVWGNDGLDQRSLRRGLCYASREDAEIAAKAMIALKGGEV